MTAVELKYTVFETDRGWAGLLASPTGLLATTLPHPSEQEACQQLGDRMSQATPSPHHFADLVERLKAYFSGRQATFPDELDLKAATNFQRQVWQITRLIPYGETRTYRWVASQLNRPEAARAVGQALGKNPMPVVVPCHRVLASDGKLGGFSGGLEMKRHLLSLEATGN